MKKLYEYVSFLCALIFTGTELLLLFILREEMKMNIFNLIVCCLAVISWLVFAVIYGRVRRIKKNPVYIHGELVPGLVRVIPFFQEYIMKATITHFDPQTGKTTLYKGSAQCVWRQYQAVRNGEHILVRIVYDAKHPSNYQVLLDEALKNVKIL